MTYVQAIPIFTKEDDTAFAYFRDHRDDVDAMTGKDLVIAMPETVAEGDADDVYSAVGNKRYEGLKRSDLPCLWMEIAGDKPFAIPLPSEKQRIAKLLRFVTDAASKSTSTAELRRKVGTHYGIVDESSTNKMLLVACALLLVLSAVALYFGLPRIHQYGTGAFTYAMYAFVGVLPAATMFVAARSYGKVSGERLGAVFEFGGAAALYVFILGLGIWFEMHGEDSSFSVAVYLHSEGKQSSLVEVTATITLLLDEAIEGRINDGRGSIERIPQKWNGKTVRFALKVDGYTLANSHSTLTLAPGEPFYLAIKKNPEVDESESGDE